MKICIVVGTRPEIIKMSPLIRESVKRDLDFFILHTGQHYSYNMDKSFFEDLELPEPKYNLEVGSATHGKQTADILMKSEQIFINEKPDVVLVQGDTNSVLACALAASKMHIRVGHVEAGLRSYDRDMPEEINRIIADHISDYLFCPTDDSKEIILNEGIDKSKIFVTGNTIVDAVLQNLKISQEKSNILERLELDTKNYILVTAHRPSNVDNKDSLNNLMSAFKSVSEKYEVSLVYPIHPRTKKMLEKFDIKVPSKLRFIEPASFLDFLQLEANAKLILTDSGGVQEEACILKVPCVTLRENTERPETIKVGSNILAGNDSDKIIESVNIMLLKNNDFKNPLGDGRAAEKIMDIIL